MKLFTCRCHHPIGLRIEFSRNYTFPALVTSCMCAIPVNVTKLCNLSAVSTCKPGNGPAQMHLGETVGSCIQGQVVTGSFYENNTDTTDSSWLEVHQQTRCPKIGSKEDEINGQKLLFNHLKLVWVCPHNIISGSHVLGFVNET